MIHHLQLEHGELIHDGLDLLHEGVVLGVEALAVADDGCDAVEAAGPRAQEGGVGFDDVAHEDYFALVQGAETLCEAGALHEEGVHGGHGGGGGGGVSRLVLCGGGGWMG